MSSRVFGRGPAEEERGPRGRQFQEFPLLEADGQMARIKERCAKRTKALVTYFAEQRLGYF